MRIALIVVLGFCAVFAWTLVAAQGSDGPPLSSTRFCGTWRPAGDRPGACRRAHDSKRILGG